MRRAAQGFCNTPLILFGLRNVPDDQLRMATGLFRLHRNLAGAVGDLAYPRPNLDRFVENYRKAGGHIELERCEGEGQAFVTRNPSSAAAAQAMEKIIDFVQRSRSATARRA